MAWQGNVESAEAAENGNAHSNALNTTSWINIR
jgi:hypothetical protein